MLLAVKIKNGGGIQNGAESVFNFASRVIPFQMTQRIEKRSPMDSFETIFLFFQNMLSKKKGR
jgi:hypothetical protein